MAELNALSTEDRVAIDRVFERLSGRTHYEVLAVAPDSSWEAISQAVRDLRKRMDASRFVGVPSEDYLRRIELVLRALDLAADVLGDPVRRFLYDQQLRRGEGRRGETPPVRPAVTPIPMKASASIPRPEARSQTLDGAPPSASSDPPLVVPAPLRRDPPSTAGGNNTPSQRPPNNRPSIIPPPMDGVGRVAPGNPGPVPMLAAPSAERRDLDTLLVEVERIAVSVQFCIAQILDPQAARVSALQNAGQALADTRAVLAAVQARRDEEAGRWSEAATNWLRATRAKPQDAGLLARLAECHHRMGDLQAADDVARRALAIDPGCEGARAVMSALARR
jgi:tetratricopeptide (TPR) repeat protein